MPELAPQPLQLALDDTRETPDPAPGHAAAAEASSAFDHPPEDYIPMEPAPAEAGEPLETYETEPGDVGLEDPAGEPASEPEPAARAAEDPDAATGDYIRLAAGLYASGAAQAFTEKRLALQRKHGAAAITDLANDPYALALALHHRALAIVDGLSVPGRPARERLAHAQLRLATAGALAMALHDRLALALAEAPAEAL